MTNTESLWKVSELFYFCWLGRNCDGAKIIKVSQVASLPAAVFLLLCRAKFRAEDCLQLREK